LCRNQGGDSDRRAKNYDPGLDEYADNADQNDQDAEGNNTDYECLMNGEAVIVIALRGKKIALFHERASLSRERKMAAGTHGPQA
jgi:hypothetical protein